MHLSREIGSTRARLVVVSVVFFIGACGTGTGGELGKLQQASGVGPTVASVTLSPSTIAGGSGATSTGTVTLSAAAPNGGQLVALSSSNTALAAEEPSVVVPAGQTSATFAIWTNPRYRRYSGLSFTVTISASANGGGQTAVLTVTAPPAPADISNDTADRHGPVCGGAFPAGSGDRGILYNCVIGPNPGTPGTCTFRKECLVAGCLTQPSNNFQFNDGCDNTLPYPIVLNPTETVGAGSFQITAQRSAPAPANGTDAKFLSSSASVTVPFDVIIPAGSTSATTTGSNTDVAAGTFASVNVDLDTINGNFEQHQLGAAWYTVLPSGGCTPTTCAAQGDNCGSISDGCGGTLNCGTCAAPQTCGGCGNLHVCCCNPLTCAGQFKNCGTLDDGCGHILNCGTCPSGQICSTGQCVVLCSTCASLGFNCGTASDGCGHTLNCGTCCNGQTCVNNVCTGTCTCTPTTCVAQGKNCGSISDGCGGTLNCGTCPGGQTCTNNVCTVSCTPKTCSQLGFNCGTASDGCGGTLDCGSCRRRQRCVNNVCQ